MEAPLAPGPQRARLAPLPTMAIAVGLLLVLLALFAALLPKLMIQFASDSLVMRALGVTVGMAGFILARVALRASAGMRQIAALTVATPLIVLGATLLVVPSVAQYPYDIGWGRAVPWILGVPGILSLLLSRWRVR